MVPPQSDERLRLFFALVPGDPMRDALGALAHAVASRAQGKAVSPPNIHLTLAFLGDTPGTSLGMLRSIGQRLPRVPFTLVLDRVGGFRASAVAWVGAREIPEALAWLHRGLNDELSRLAFAVDQRPFRAHVTLARKCRRVVHETLDRPLAWPPTDVSLVASTLAPRGSIYRTLASWPLDGTPAQEASGTV